MSASAQFEAIATSAVDDLLRADPVGATWLGDHRFDDLLPDLTSSGQAELAQRVEDHLTALDAVDDLDLDVDEQVDLEILRAALTRVRFEATELQAHRWNPMAWNPGTGIYLLVSRDFAPEDERMAAARARIAAIPELLAAARDELVDMPAIHVETALGQFHGTEQLVAQLEPDGAAVQTIRAFRDWLGERLPESRRSPRLGERLYAAQLWHSLDDPRSAASLLEDANAHLDAVTSRMRELAAEYLGETPHATGIVTRALAQIAAEHPVSDATVLPIVADAVERTRAFVVERGLVSMPSIDVDVIEMPEIHRGVAVAYCDAPGPLERVSLPTRVAVSPTPADWDAERVASFYREYNAVQLHDLTIHEAFPGHVLQLAHARAVERPLRRYGFNGPFVEGWAVHAEQVMIDAGYAPAGDDPRLALALRLQQLKMQARMTINTILDIRVHCMDMTQEEGMSLMTRRGFQEEGEATGKWRRALLTAGQLPTYFAGWRSVSAIAADLHVLHPDWTQGQVHDLMLSHGSIAPRHLRTLLGI